MLFGCYFILIFIVKMLSILPIELVICRLDMRKQQKKLLCINKSAGFYMQWYWGIYVILDESIENALI